MIKKIAVGLVISVLLVVAIFHLDVDLLVESLLSLSPWVLVLLFALQIITQLLINLQWYLIAKASGSPIAYRDMVYIHSQGSIVDAITPGVKIGGEMTRGVLLAKIGQYTPSQAGAVVAVQKIISILAMAVVMLLLASHVVAWVAVALLAPFIIAPGPIRRYVMGRQAPKHPLCGKVRGFFIMLLHQLMGVKANKKICLLLWGISICIWALYPIKSYVLVLQFYPDAHFIYIAGITFGAYMVAMLPIFPGGVGGFEGTMIGLLVAMGLGLEGASMVAILFRFMTFWLVMLMGVVYVWGYKWKVLSRE